MNSVSPVNTALAAAGIAGAAVGILAGKRLAARRRVLEVGFALLVLAVGVYVAAQGL